MGLAADLVGRRTGVPRVTLLILCGVLAGPNGVALIPPLPPQLLSDLSMVTLSFVAFLLGSTFDRSRLGGIARAAGVISVCVTLVTLLVVALVVWLAGLGPVMALALGAVATATDPIATADVVREQKAHEGAFAKRLLAIVALDDAWGILAFSLAMTLAVLLADMPGQTSLLLPVREIGGALLLGGVLAVPMVLLTGRVDEGEPTLVEALGFVLICAGLAEWLEVSTLIAAMTMGALTINFARHHSRPFHAIEGIEWPLLIMFFVLTGASVGIADPAAVGGLTALYVGARLVGRWLGGHLGGRLSGLDARACNWTGPALLPQAGVALGMALVAAQRFPELGEAFLSAVALSTILFELFGPVLTRVALSRAERDTT